MWTDRFKSFRGVPRASRTVGAALAAALFGAVLTVGAPASAQNLVANPTFSITGGTSSFWFGGYSQWGGSESLGSWAFIPAGSGNIGAGFDFANGTTAACYGGSSGCSGGSIETVLPVAITAPVGSNFIAIDSSWGGATQNSGVSQSISGLTSGATYKLTFSYALTQWSGFTGSDSAAVTAILGSASQTTSPIGPIATQTFSGWATSTFTYVANATTETLQLLASSGSGQPPLVLLANVSLTKAPEPMSIAILGTGILGLVTAARKRRAPKHLA